MWGQKWERKLVFGIKEMVVDNDYYFYISNNQFHSQFHYDNILILLQATGSACIEIIKHLTVLSEHCHNPALHNIAAAHKTKMRDIVKRLVETVKVRI